MTILKTFLLGGILVGVFVVFFESLFLKKKKPNLQENWAMGVVVLIYKHLATNL